MEQLEKKYAGFWWRFLAYIIDGLVVGVAVWAIAIPIGILIGIGAYSAASDGEINAGAAVAGIIGAALLLYILYIVIVWLYFAILESSKLQASIGKLAIGLIVTDMEGNRISFGRATGRFFGKLLSGMILLIGYIMAGLTEKKQGLHDILAGTLVWKK
ncbi:MAG: RDD family protein [Bacteroidales bacterium]|nr:MAG: RDD family protein [Bacteroidales bacterium]